MSLSVSASWASSRGLAVTHSHWGWPQCIVLEKVHSSCVAKAGGLLGKDGSLETDFGVHARGLCWSCPTCRVWEIVERHDGVACGLRVAGVAFDSLIIQAANHPRKRLVPQ